jgi:hypothetical protein
VTPFVGRIVHYVSHGTPVRADGSQEFESQCRAAIVTEVYWQHTYDGVGNKVGPAVPDLHAVGLCVLNPTGQFFRQGVVFDDDDDPAQRAGGSWHWPEREESGHP